MNVELKKTLPEWKELHAPDRIKMAVVTGVIFYSNKMTLFFDIKIIPLVFIGVDMHQGAGLLSFVGQIRF